MLLSFSNFFLLSFFIVGGSFQTSPSHRRNNNDDNEESTDVKHTDPAAEQINHPVKVIFSSEKRRASNPAFQRDEAIFVERSNDVLLPLRSEVKSDDDATRKACQVTVQMPENYRCSLGSKVEGQISSLHSLLTSMQAQMNYQRRRLDSADSFIRRIRYTITNRQDKRVTSNHDRQSLHGRASLTIGGRSSDSGHRRRSEAASTLQSLSEEIQAMLTNLEIQIDEADSEREILRINNHNLTQQLNEKEKLIDNLTEENIDLRKNESSLIESLRVKENEKLLLQTKNQQLKRQKNLLQETKLGLETDLGIQQAANKRLTEQTIELNSELETLRLQKNEFEQTLSNVTKEIKEKNSIITTLNSKNKTRCKNENGIPAFDEKEETIPVYTHCGVLLNVSEPQTIRQSRKPILHRVGVWMKDPIPSKHNNRIWLINQSGVRVRKMFQYSNMSAFQNHQSESTHILPAAVESNGAVVYNGSLYFQGRNSRRMVRYDIENRNRVVVRSIKRAGFHGMFAYQWGGFTDIDFATDETGLWVIYSTPRSRGNIIVSEVNPKNLKILRTIRTPIPKRKVANAFIICRILYTVSGFRTSVASINYSFDLNTRKWKKLNIPFLNNYQFNTMVDYNPKDRYLYSWDNGRQVRYKVSLDKSLGEINSRVTSAATSTTETRANS